MFVGVFCVKCDCSKACKAVLMNACDIFKVPEVAKKAEAKVPTPAAKKEEAPPAKGTFLVGGFNYIYIYIC